MIRKAPNINHLWAHLVVEELIRCGVSHFFIAPGSRSTPLVTAVARHSRAHSVVHFDERGTAFAALGFARAAGMPAAWITTSGTAVANGLPAIVEAFVDGVPFLALTADRPPELRKSGANQTIEQPGIFGDYIRWFFDLPVPSLAIPPNVVLTTLDQAVHRSAEGPVHLNLMFREPLEPKTKDDNFDRYLQPVRDWEKGNKPFTAYASTIKVTSKKTIGDIRSSLERAKRGLVVAGRTKHPSEGNAAFQLAQALRWPLFADVGASIRDLDGENTLIRRYDFLLDSAQMRGKPDVIIQLGKGSVSKKLASWIDETIFDEYVLIDSYPNRIDPLHRVTKRLEVDIVSFCNQILESAVPANSDWETWLARWKKEDARVERRLEEIFGLEPELSEPAVARAVVEQMREDQILVVGNSMPVRDVDVFSRNKDQMPRIILNRGASGIDGTIATAIGAVMGRRVPATVLLGDLSLLHDLNSLALVKNLASPLAVVVVNNDGGGIFSFLPISSYADVFDSHFALPHGLNFEYAAGMFALRYEQPGDMSAFRSAHQNALEHAGCTLIEVKTNRTKNLAIHRFFYEQLMTG